MTTTFNWKIAGAAGEGIKKAGLIFAKACSKHGLAVHGYTEYPSLIRGGHNTFQVHASSEKNQSPKKKLDLLVALNQEGVDLHQDELDVNSITIFDNLPLTDLAKEAGGTPQMKNIAALGASCYLLGLSLELLNQSIIETFAKKDQSIIDLNLKIASNAYQSAKAKLPNQAHPSIAGGQSSDQLLISGNHSLALGAIAGGMKLYIAYPMTPATSILHILANATKKADITVRHAEDEIGVINMAVGAGFTGVRTMVATSGGGFSLMTEGLGLAGVTETPVVIVNAMRPGPASGMPTWTGQGDLLYMINASQDEFPRIVMTPGDPEECFNLGKLAQNLSEKYQLPTIILTDKFLGESYFTTDKFPTEHQNQRYHLADTTKLDNDTPFKRYQVTETGISPRTLPGQSGGVHLCNSYEHDQEGIATEESATRTEQVNKRALKMTTLINDPDLPQPVLYGPESAKTTLISWGSNKGVILEALKQLKDTNFIHFPLVWPFPKDQFLTLLKNVKNPITVECNANGQLNQLIRQQTGQEIKSQLLKYDGRPFFPGEIVTYVQKSH